jgi:heat shock protein HtpX
MTEKLPDLPSYPLWPTILAMTGLALVGGFVWWAVTFAGSATAIASSGPFAWFTMGPPLVAAYGMAATIGIVALPLWCLAGSGIFASKSSGKEGSAATEMGVTFFSETHPIAKVTQAMAKRMGLPPIAYVGWYPGEDINAFAMGNAQNNALVAVSKGAVERLTKEQLVAVLAHELGHVASNDMARMSHALGTQQALTFFLVFRGLQNFARWIFTPLSELEILRMSRAREFTADRISAIMLGPEHMVSALEKLRHETAQPPLSDMAKVMMWSGLGGGSLLSTHPPLEDRIAKLREFQVAKPAIAIAPTTAAAASE